MQRASNSSTQPLIRVSGEIKQSKYQRYFLFSRLFTLPHQFWVSGSCGCWMIKLVAFEAQTYFRSQLVSFVGREATTRNASALRRLLNWLLKLLRSNRQITPPNIILEGQFYEAEFEKNSGTNSTNWKNVVKKRALVKLASLTSSSRRAESRGRQLFNGRSADEQISPSNLKSGPIWAVLIHSLWRLPLKLFCLARQIFQSETKIEPDLISNKPEGRVYTQDDTHDVILGAFLIPSRHSILPLSTKKMAESGVVCWSCFQRFLLRCCLLSEKWPMREKQIFFFTEYLTKWGLTTFKI